MGPVSEVWGGDSGDSRGQRGHTHLPLLAADLAQPDGLGPVVGALHPALGAHVLRAKNKEQGDTGATRNVPNAGRVGTASPGYGEGHPKSAVPPGWGVVCGARGGVSPSCSPRRRHRRSPLSPAAPRRGCSGSRRPPARCGACPPAGSSGAWREGTGMSGKGAGNARERAGYEGRVLLPGGGRCLWSGCSSPGCRSPRSLSLSSYGTKPHPSGK